MKLRLRSLESNKTLKVFVTNSCTLHQLKQLLAISTGLPAFSLHLSLNRGDELHSPNPDDTLQSIGLRSGDLVFHTQNPKAFVNPNPNQNWGEREWNEDSRGQDPAAMDSESTPNLGVSSDGGLYSDMTNSFPEEQRLDSSTTKTEGGLGNSDSVSHCFVFDGDADIDGWVVVHIKYSRPYLLRIYGGHRHRALVNAVDEVMLASGLVGIDPVTGMRADRFCLSDQWPFNASTLSLRYSLAAFVTDGDNKAKSVILKFQSWGHFITVYGSLAKCISRSYWVALDEHRFGPVIVLMREKNEKNAQKRATLGSSCSYAEKEVCEFLKIVKDRLALPLLIDLTEEVGLPLPSCFMCLPDHLKLKIFDSLTGVDLAKVGCVSSELRNLADDNDLWKRKYADEFGEPVEIQGSVNWKQRFAMSWEAKKGDWELSWGQRDCPNVGEEPTQFGVDGVPAVRDPYWSPYAGVQAEGLHSHRARPNTWAISILGLPGGLVSSGGWPNPWAKSILGPVGPTSPPCGLESRGALAPRELENYSY